MSALRPALSKLTRSKLARRAYDALVAAGLRVAVLDEFHRDLTSDPPERGAHRSISIDTSAVTTEARTAGDPTLDADRLRLEAVAEGTTIGRVQLACSSPVNVPELDRSVDLSGGYIHDLLVEPAWRRSGVGSALVRAACVRLDERDISTAAALIAPDNAPSRRLFQSLGFTSINRHVTVAIGPWRYGSSRNDAGE